LDKRAAMVIPDDIAAGFSRTEVVGLAWIDVPGTVLIRLHV